ncbi:acetate kinase [Paenibacillus sp. GD4]|uniref:acetate/propionate family kinase n=1 Tax=Paenibacillus sp. GD4 TaxID=3068890 RepID=UPI0027968584|nr:acetate kinase [Paenibacillus sp. GD4]MDQ1909907.1 acetate kinase [Paenibacillus sp. GD4]
MNILVINSGSSSVKYQLYDMSTETLKVKGRIERIGSESAQLVQQAPGREEWNEVREVLNHSAAIEQMIRLLVDPILGVIKSIRDIHGVGHRVVHGGEAFTAEALIDEEVKRQIRKLYDLAPLHNPAHMVGITAVEQHLQGIPQAAVFDTAFHQTMPAHAYLYPIPKVLYRKHGVRRYGFHGTSHEYVSGKAAELLGLPIEDLKMISCHIGNGASCTAIDGGRSVDTSMGMTPLEGLMMGTRSGDLDPAILPFLMVKEELSVHEVNSMLNKHSGLLAVSGISGDVREVLTAAMDGDGNAQLALDMYEYRIRKYIGAYTAAMDGMDVLIFTGGVGENAAYIRERVCSRLSYLGVKLDQALNAVRSSEERIISEDCSRVKVMVIPTNEELMIARKTYTLLTADSPEAYELEAVGKG